MPQRSTRHAGEAKFDHYAVNYDAALSQAISISGEDKDFFARGRVQWLKDGLTCMGFSPKTVLDFGCGTGSAAPHLLSVLDPQSLIGVDVSGGSIQVANQAHRYEHVCFLNSEKYVPRAEIDLAYCSNVFHHIPLPERAGAIDYVYQALKLGGLFAFWEINAWNPAALYVMSRCPFDDDAIPIAPAEARRLLKAGGFEILRTDFLFIFPRFLRWFRGIEPLVSRLPLGTQYQVLCRKPCA